MMNRMVLSIFLFLLVSAQLSYSAKVDQAVTVTAVNGDATIYSSSDLAAIEDLKKQYSDLKEHLLFMKKIYHDMLVSAVQLMQGGTDPQTTSQIGDSPIPYVVQLGQATGDLAAAEDIIEQNQEKLDALKAQLDAAEEGSGAGTLFSSVDLSDITTLSSGYVITATVTSNVKITSDSQTVTLTPGTQVYLLADPLTGAQLIDVLQGKVSITTGAGTEGVVIVSGNKYVTHKDTSFFVERYGDNFTVGSYEGVIGITDFSTLKFYAIPSNYQITFLANESVHTGKTPTNKAELISISLNGSDSYSIKPLIELVFDSPVDENSLSGNLLCNGTNYGGHFFIQGDTDFFFVPSGPVNAGACIFSFIGVDRYNNSLSHTSKFNTFCEKPGADHSLFSPAALKVTKSFYAKNTLDRELVFHDVALYLLQNFSNAFVHVDSITPSTYQLKRDSFGNEYVLWPAEQAVQPGKNITYEINYTVFSFGITYFDFLDFGALNYSSYPAFTKSTLNIQSDNEEIKSVAGSLKGRNALENAHRITNWLSSNIAYDNSLAQDGGALVTFQNGFGVCNGYASLFAAFARTSGIPTKYDVGILDQGYHSFNEMYIGGRWIPLDPTGIRGPNDYFAALKYQLKEAELEDLSDSKETYYSYTLKGRQKTYTYDYEYTTNRNIAPISPEQLDPKLRSLYYLLYLQDFEVQLTYLNASFGCAYYDNAKDINELFENCRTGQCDETKIKSKLGTEFNKTISILDSEVRARLNQIQGREQKGYPVLFSHKQALLDAQNSIESAKAHFATGDYNSSIVSLEYASQLLYSTPNYDPVDEDMMSIIPQNDENTSFSIEDVSIENETYNIIINGKNITIQNGEYPADIISILQDNPSGLVPDPKETGSATCCGAVAMLLLLVVVLIKP